MSAKRISFSAAGRALRTSLSGLLLAVLALGFGACDFINGPPGAGGAPRVQILRPGTGAVVAGEVVVRVSASAQGENNYVSFVNVNLDSKLLGEAQLVEGSEPATYVLRWNSTSVEDGVYRLEAIAFDRDQARGLSNRVEVTVQNKSTGEGPATVVAAPRDGESVDGIVHVIGQRQEGEPEVIRMDLYVDGVAVASRESAPFEFEWNTEQEAAGQHVLRLKAFGAPGVFRFSEPVTVVIEADEEDTTGTGGPGEAPEAALRAVGFTGDVKGSVAVGFNNDLYIGTLSDTLYAFSPSGKLKWKFGTGGPIRSTPVVGNNEDVFITSEDGRLYGLTSTGRQLWPAYVTTSLLRSTPTLGLEGNLYFGDSEGQVHAVNSFSGQPVAGYPRKVAGAPIIVPPVMGPDRTLIVASTDGRVYALEPDGRVRWMSPVNVGSISVGMALVERKFATLLPDGSTLERMAMVLYIVSNTGHLYALSGEDGTSLWTEPLTGPLRSGPVVGPDGTVYVGTSTGLMAFREDTNEDRFSRLLWIYPAEDVGTPVIDANQNIFFVSGRRLVGIHPNNTPLWTQSFDLRGQADGPLTIGRDGRIYVACNNGMLYGIASGSVGLAEQKWPMFQRNARHTGRLGIDATDG